MNRQSCQRVWSQIQNGSIETEQNSKTSRGESNYFSRVTE